MSDLAIQVENLGKRFRLGVGAGGHDTLRDTLAHLVRRKAVDQRELWALRGVNLEVPRGQAVGIIGHNGAGKSTLLRILARITAPTEGVARTRGTVGSLLDVGTGFHNELTGRENVYLSGAVMGMRRKEVQSRFDEIVEFSGVERFLDTPVKRYSEGMRLRLAFAVAAHLEPPIVVVDEVLAVGDAAFREKCMGKMAEMGKLDRTVLFVSHDLSSITKLCSRAVWLQSGHVQDDGPAHEVVASYLAGATPGQLLDAEFEHDPHEVVSIQRLTVRDDATKKVLESVCRGETFTVEMTFVLRDSVSHLNTAVIIIDENGRTIFDDAVGDGSVEIARELTGTPGTYKVSATIPPVLKAGTYLVRAWIGGSGGTLVVRDLLSIRVDPRLDDSEEYRERNRLVTPAITWTVAREG